MAEEELPLYLHWCEFLRWLFGRTEKFPRRVRLSISQRLEALGLDVLEDIVEARYTRDRRAILQRVNLRLEKMRVLLRLCHDQKFLPHDGYEYGFRLLLEAGKMVGGWLRASQARPGVGRTPMGTRGRDQGAGSMPAGAQTDSESSSPGGAPAMPSNISQSPH